MTRLRLGFLAAFMCTVTVTGCASESGPSSENGPATSQAAPGRSAPAQPTTPSAVPTSPATPSSTPEPAGDPIGTECETVVLTAAEVPAYVFIRAGKVRCREATRVMQDYYLAISKGAAPGAGGGGPVDVGAWTCLSGPATDPGSECRTEDGRKIEAEIDA